MADFRQVTPDFAVAPQIAPSDLAEAARQGFRLVINNRPDAEAPDQPSGAVIETAARAAGLDYLALPIVGRPTPAQAEAQRAAATAGKTLAFCRSGTRSITAWLIGEAAAGRDRGELLALARAAGYDLSAVT